MAITKEDVNRILGISENYELPDRLLSVMLDKERRQRCLEEFSKLESDYSYDWFNEYFQNEHGDRDGLKQDYTPSCIAKLLKGLSKHGETVADICSGSGSLTIAQDAKKYYCEELSSRVLPILLLNLAIRNKEATVFHGDSLTRESKAIYSLSSGERFSDIRQAEKAETLKADNVVTNPPYSLKWEPFNDDRWQGFGTAPKSKSDYAFLLHALSMMKEDGRTIAVMFPGILYRGSAEARIREELNKGGYIRAVIALPKKLFMHTDIPVVVMVLERGWDEVLFVDATREFKSNGRKNDLTDENIDKIVSVFSHCLEVDKYSHIAKIEEIDANDYNLSTSLYVDTFEPEPIIDLSEVVSELREKDKKRIGDEIQLYESLREINIESNGHKEFLKYMEERVSLYGVEEKYI